jgi:uncharacterized protein (DUF1697 family)
MKFIALMRGINVGGNRKIEMKRLKALVESLGYKKVSTYINSGNVLFESIKKQAEIKKEIETALKKELEFEIATIIKTEREMKIIADSIPKQWQNNPIQRTDVAFLFPEIDSKKILAELPVKRGYIDIRYTKGAIFWNINRENLNKSQLNRLVGHKLYKLMTIRNVNTARVLAGYLKR